MFLTGLLLGCALAVAEARLPPAGAQAFDHGMTAFRKGDFPQALVAFLEARRDGIHDPQLSYDLGVTYYRLGRYAEARREFTALTGLSSLAALSHYNLGLIAMRQHNAVCARTEFNAAYSQAREPALRTLARKALGELGTTPAPVFRWTAFAGTTAGYDSNVALTSESTVLTPAHRGSGMYSLLAGAIGQLTGNSLQGWQAVGTFYRVDYPQVSQFDQSYVHLGGQYRWGSERWNHMLGFYAGNLTLGSSKFESLATVSADTQYDLTSNDTLRGFYRYTRIQGGTDFDYLSGWHQSLGVENTLHMSRADLTLGYTFDFNERNNFNAGSQFLSASPTDNGLYGILNWHFTDITALYAETDYQHSHYQGADTVLANGAAVNIFREENHWSTTLGLHYFLSQRWSLRFDCSFTDNRSNIPQFSYHSNQIMTSLDYVFAH